MYPPSVFILGVDGLFYRAFIVDYNEVIDDNDNVFNK